MNRNKRPVDIHKAYHAHIYFSEDSKVLAKTLCENSADKFGLKVGRFHEKTIGPHLQRSCQVIFGAKDFDRYIT